MVRRRECRAAFGGLSRTEVIWRLRLGFWGLAITLGALQAWAHRNAINADGISYLDIGDAYLRGDWRSAVNLIWSPLYPLLLGVAVQGARSSASWEFPLVHLVNFVVYLAAIATFEFLLRSLSSDDGQGSGWPEWSWLSWGYALFLTATLALVDLGTTTADMIVLAIVFLVAGILARVTAGALHLRWFLGFGAVLAIGYFAKPVMFPVALLSFLLAVLAIGDLRRGLPRVLAGVAMFCLLAGPFVVALSVVAGRFTLGEVGTYAYVWNVNRESQPPMFRFARAQPLSWSPRHPPRKVLDEPAVYEFGSPIPGTFPLWYDPWYWHRDAQVRIDLSRHVSALMDGLAEYARILLRLTPLTIGLIASVMLVGRRWRREGRLRRGWVLLVLAGAPLLLYALVRVDGRYVGGFVAVLYLAVLSAVRVPDHGRARRMSGAVCIGAVVLQLLLVSFGVAYDVAHEIKAIIRADATANRHWNAARALRDLGIRPGDRVAAAGDYFTAGWARLARVRIVAVVDDPTGLTCWASIPSCRERLAAALAATGAAVLVVESPPARVVATHGWKRLGLTQFYAYPLR